MKRAQIVGWLLVIGFAPAAWAATSPLGTVEKLQLFLDEAKGISVVAAGAVIIVMVLAWWFQRQGQFEVPSGAARLGIGVAVLSGAPAILGALGVGAATL